MRKANENWDPVVLLISWEISESRRGRRRWCVLRDARQSLQRYLV